ncbi:MAG: fumarylacetoacetate hydrolase family protein [Muribaculaceae bacterium]|nr:fumarylacetoacetate hydrolase family protein [Muribaculaceae bacterium]MDE6382239.1 fumarylacetoacetate hydrolase family protein [Muribaculaceae bacterium]
MKIFAVIHNYGTPCPDALMGEGKTTWYEMPDSSVLRSGNPFFVPDSDTEYLAFPSVCYRIGRLGKSIAPRFARRYIDAATIAVAVVAANRLREARRDGMPWTEATAFDRSCMLGNLTPIDTFIEYGPAEIGFGDRTITYDTALLRLQADRLVEAVSTGNTLKNGDLILAGLTSEGIRLNPGMRITAEIAETDMKLIDINIR